MMMYVTFAIKAVASTLMTLFSWFLANWWLPLFASEDGWLPKWLWFFQTQDADLDRGFRDGNGDSIKNSWVRALYVRSRYVRRVFWLYRNTSYAFDDFLGIPYVAEDWTIVECGPNGLPFHAIHKDGHFSRKFVWHGAMFKLGFKSFWHFDITAKTFRDIKGERVPFVFSISKAK